jgi:hypothetical protein
LAAAASRLHACGRLHQEILKEIPWSDRYGRREWSVKLQRGNECRVSLPPPEKEACPDLQRATSSAKTTYFTPKSRRVWDEP